MNAASRAAPRACFFLRLRFGFGLGLGGPNTNGSLEGVGLALSGMSISLEDLDTSLNGGLLSYSLHASVEIPIDVVYFSINDRTLHVYDKVTGSGDDSDQYSNGEWETVSVLLQPGEHVLTWSYQYYGMPTINSPNYDASYVMDPRRVGNTWLDDITFELFTGDVIL